MDVKSQNLEMIAPYELSELLFSEHVQVNHVGRVVRRGDHVLDGGPSTPLRPSPRRPVSSTFSNDYRHHYNNHGHEPVGR